MEITEQTEGQPNSGTQPEKIFDADNDKWIDNPALKKEEPADKDKDKPDAKKDKPDPKAAESEEQEEEEQESEGEESEEEGSEEEAEEEEEQGEEKTEAEEEAEKDKSKGKKAKDDDGLTPDAYVEQTYGEKYGLKTEADLKKTIENAIDIVDELKAVKAERDTLKADSGKPKFASKAHESAYEFVSKFDPTMQGEALQTFAKLVTMDIDAGDPMMLLEEKFVHENPQWTRSEAQRMFKKEYAKKYTLNREKFEGSEAEFAEEQADVEIMKKGDIARAKTYLKDLREKHKPAAAEQPKTNEAVTKAIEKNTKEYDAHFQKSEEVVFEDAGDKYSYKLDAEKKKQVSEAMKAWVNNPLSYNEKGELIGATTPEEMFQTIVGGLFLKDIVKSLKSQVKNKVSTKRVEEIAAKTPKKRTTPGSGEAKTNKDDLDEQAIRLIKKKAA